METAYIVGLSIAGFIVLCFLIAVFYFGTRKKQDDYYQKVASVDSFPSEDENRNDTLTQSFAQPSINAPVKDNVTPTVYGSIPKSTPTAYGSIPSPYSPQNGIPSPAQIKQSKPYGNLLNINVPPVPKSIPESVPPSSPVQPKGATQYAPLPVSGPPIRRLPESYGSTELEPYENV